MHNTHKTKQDLFSLKIVSKQITTSNHRHVLLQSLMSDSTVSICPTYSSAHIFFPLVLQNSEIFQIFLFTCTHCIYSSILISVKTIQVTCIFHESSKAKLRKPKYYCTATCIFTLYLLHMAIKKYLHFFTDILLDIIYKSGFGDTISSSTLHFCVK